MSRRWAMTMVLALAMAATCAPGCATPDADGDAEWQPPPLRRIGTLIEPPVASDLGYRVNWVQNLSLSDGQRIASVVLLDDLLVVVQEPRNLVTAISLRDGQVLWNKSIGTPEERTFAPVRVDDLILVNTETRLFALSADNGRVEHITPLPGAVAVSPVVAEQLVIFGGVTGRVFAFQLGSGILRWGYQLQSRVLAEPVLIDFNVFVADASGVYALFKALTGELLWRSRTFGAIVAPPAVDRLSIYVASTDQTLYALNRTDGREVWKLPLEHPLTMPPTAIGLSVYVPVPEAGLVAVDSLDGSIKWRTDLLLRPVLGSETRLLAYGPTALYVLDPADGTILEQAPTRRLSTVLEGPEQSLILLSPAGELLRLNPRQ